MARGVVVLTGDKRLNRMLAKLSGPQGKAAIRKASRPALRPVLEEAKRTVPVSKKRKGRERGKLKRSLAIRAIARSRVRVGHRVTTRYGMFKGVTFYGGFQEWGWQPGKRGSIKRAARVEGKYFMTNAAKTKKQAALSIYRKVLEQEITALARRS